jgi:predicted O-linked N-acetylglucosamine transferase (SPINDLY family)
MPNHVDAKHLLGVIALQSGRLDEAQALISEALALNPRFAEAHNNLGNVHLRQNRIEDARKSFQRAVELKPGYGDAHLNLANQLRRQRRFQDAAAHFRRAIAANGKSLTAHVGLGAALLDLGDARGAVQALEAAAKLKPDNAETLSNLGIALAHSGESKRALEMLDRAASLASESAVVLRHRGAVLGSLGRNAEAKQSLEKAIALEPDSPAAHCNLGNVLRESGLASEGLAHFRRASELDPAMIEAQIGLVRSLQDVGLEGEAREQGRKLLRDRPDSPAAFVFEGSSCMERDDTKGAAAAFRRAIELQASNAEAHYLLGNVLMRQLRSADAIASYRRAIASDPAHGRARWALTMAQIPPLPGEESEVAKSRASFTRMLGELDQWFDGARSVDGYRAVGAMQPYYLAYQVFDNRDMLARYGKLCARLMELWRETRVGAPAPRSGSGPIRVGIASAHLRQHSVWNAIIKGWIKHLDRKRFELVLFNLGDRSDAETEQGRRWASRLETGRRELSQWANTIAASDLDVLIYPEIGMDPLTVKLASTRLARIQAATWGHPETTGLPTIDYYISAQGLEPLDADKHYTERLVILPNLGVCYESLAPVVQVPDLAALGLPQDVPLLLCPGTPFKYAPANDAVWIEIAQRAAPCRLVFFRPADGEVSPMLEERLAKRFVAAGLRFVDCVTFIPTLDRARYFGLMQRAHLMLDTIGFSGFNTVIQAIECGLPVVSREADFMRGRLGSGILRHIGMDALVAESDDAYVELAVALTRDSGRRDALRDEIVRRRSALFGDAAPVRALEGFLESAVRNPRTP